MTDVKRIETYGLYEFCQEVQSAIQDGYSFDFESSENFPTAFGSLLVCGLIKARKEVEATDDVAVVAPTVNEVEAETVAETSQTAEVVQDEVQTEVEAEGNAEATPAKRGPKPKAK
jgi:hypothetical protein